MGVVGEVAGDVEPEASLIVEGKEDGALEGPIRGGLGGADDEELPALEAGEAKERRRVRGRRGSDNDPAVGAE